MSTAGAHALRLEWSPVRSKVSLNRRLIWSCRVVTPRKGSHLAMVLIFVSTSIGDCTRIIKNECTFVKYKVKGSLTGLKALTINQIERFRSLLARLGIAET